MAYFCLCGHKRGVHDNPLKDPPGKCNSVNCGCSKYNSKIGSQPFRDKPVHIREFVYQLGLWVLGSILCITLFSSDIKTLALLPLIPFSVITTLFWFLCMKPFNKINEVEKLEK